MMKNIRTKREALNYLFGYIPKRRIYMYPGDWGLRRTKYLLKLMGQPQNVPKIIHVAGTSGKGSTAYYISTILRSLGFNVGLSVSPHLLDVRERFQINNKLLNQQEFCKYLNEIYPIIEKVSKTKPEKPTYFEITTALAYYIFGKKQVDYAVIETGLGGLLDATNAVERSNKLAVITKIGHDHTNILGTTLKEIAFQKAGIIKQRNIVVSLNQHPQALRVIKKASLLKKAKLHLISGTETKNISLIPEPKFDFEYSKTIIKNIKLRMLGSFQIQNCSLALAVIILLSQRDGFSVNTIKIKNALKHALFPGRMQKLKINNQTVIIDGAHNPQKMAVFTNNLKLYFPAQKLTFLLAFKKGKDYRAILRYILPLAQKIIVTTFFNQTKSQGFVNIAENPHTIARTISDLNFKDYCVCENSEKALKMLLRDKKTVGVITGSLYLLSEICSKFKLHTISGKNNVM